MLAKRHAVALHPNQISLVGDGVPRHPANPRRLRQEKKLPDRARQKKRKTSTETRARQEELPLAMSHIEPYARKRQRFSIDLRT